MEYFVKTDRINIVGKEDFVPEHILECGQIFSYEKINDDYYVYSKNEMAKISETENGYTIFTDNPLYFEEFFDLKTDYSKIKKQLLKYELLKNPILYGKGIRILKQDLFEVLISFIVSANNNIKRIKSILNKFRINFGKKIGEYYAFPTRESLLKCSIEDFTSLGAGYRAKYLYNVLRQIDENTLKEWESLSTRELRGELIKLSGVGPKVADCIMLFGFSRKDVFPVDTWINKMYNQYYKELSDRNKIRDNLIEEFGNFSGYAQQYLFFFIRSLNN